MFSLTWLCMQVDIPSCFVALILENCELPYPNHGHVILADPSPILFYRISSLEIRCLVDIPACHQMPSISNGEMTNYLKSKVAPQVFKVSLITGLIYYFLFSISDSKDLTIFCMFQIPPELFDAFISAINKGNIRTMPNRSMPAAPHPTPGALLLGDAFNMRHPLTGGGMTVALSDIVVLRNLLRPLCDFSDAKALCEYLKSFYTLRKVTQLLVFMVFGKIVNS